MPLSKAIAATAVDSNLFWREQHIRGVKRQSESRPFYIKGLATPPLDGRKRGLEVW